MTDYISRLSAIHGITEAFDDVLSVADAIEILDKLPAADVREVKRGHWIDRYSGGNLVPFDDVIEGCPAGSCYCSVCGDWLTASDEYPARGNFCPNCGADMREEQT